MKYLLSILALATTVVAQTLTLSGSVISDNQKMITSRFMGFVTSVKVSEGDKVKRGQVLYTIDSREIDSGVRQAELSLQMYQNQYANVKLNLERYKRLYKQDMVSKYEVENLELNAKNLQDMMNIAKAQLDEVKSQYKYLIVKAPNDGVIIKKNIKVGEMAMPGMPALILSDLSNLKIEVEIAEQDMKSIFVGKKVQVNIPSLNLTTQGKIAAIIPSSNPMTHTFKVKIALDAQNAKIYPGMYATVNIEVK